MKTSDLQFESNKILASLSEENREYFLSFAKKLTFKKGQLLFFEGGVATGVFLIKSGKAKIFNVGIYGKEQIFYIYKKDDLLGYHALLSDEPYEDSCQALEDCEVLFITKNDFEHLLQNVNKLKLLFIRNMSHEFGVLVNTITILAQRSLRERLAIFLLILNDRYYDEERGESLIVLPREDLANIVGTTRESLGRLLRDFKEDQFIQIEKRSIKIINRTKLRELANDF